MKPNMGIEERYDAVLYVYEAATQKPLGYCIVASGAEGPSAERISCDWGRRLHEERPDLLVIGFAKKQDAPLAAIKWAEELAIPAEEVQVGSFLER